MDAAVIVFTARGNETAVYKATMLDAGAAYRIGHIRNDPHVAKMGARFKAELAVKWADDALKEAKEAGSIPDYEAQDVLILANMALQHMILEG